MSESAFVFLLLFAGTLACVLPLALAELTEPDAVEDGDPR